MDTIRVLRVLEYVGPRDLVEKQVAASIHGELKTGPGNQITIKAATIGTFPEILEPAPEPEPVGCLLGEKCTCEEAWMPGCKQFRHPLEICARGDRCTCIDPSPSRCNAFRDANAVPRR